MIAIVNIGQLVTISGSARPRSGAELNELAIINDAAILIDDGRIIATGKYSELKSQIPPHSTEIDAARSAVTPGFVDGHTHLVFAGNRAAEFEQRIAGATYQQIAAAGGGILRTVALVPPLKTNSSLPRAAIATGCSARAQRPSKPNPATASTATPNSKCSA
jgi:imidazolonepropionase